MGLIDVCIEPETDSMALVIQFEPPDFSPGRDLDKLVEELGELSGERPQLHLEEAAPEAGGPDVEVVFLWISYGVSTVQAMRYLAKAVGWLRQRFRESPPRQGRRRGLLGGPSTCGRAKDHVRGRRGRRCNRSRGPSRHRGSPRAGERMTGDEGRSQAHTIIHPETSGLRPARNALFWPAHAS